MTFIPSNIPRRVLASGWAAYEDADSSHYADPQYLNAGDLATNKGHFNSVLEELRKTQLSLSNLTGTFANVLDYGIVGDGVTDDTTAFQDLCADPTYDVIFIPPKCAIRITRTVYVPQKKMILGNFGTRTLSGALPSAAGFDPNRYSGEIIVDLVSPYSVGLQLGGIQGMAGVFMFASSGSRQCWMVDWNFIEEVKKQVSISQGSPCVVTENAHGLTNGTKVVFGASRSLPAPLDSVATYKCKEYYVKNKTTNTYELSETSNGPSIATTSAGVGSFYRMTNPFYTKDGYQFFDCADDPSTESYGPGSSDGFFGNNWFANYSGGFNGLGCVKITCEIQGWWFVNNIFDGYYQYGLRSLNQSINCRFIGNRYFCPPNNWNGVACVEFVEPYSNVFSQNLYDHGAGWGMRLIRPQDNLFSNEDILAKTAGIYIDNSTAALLPWYVPFDGETGDESQYINGNSNHFTNIKIGMVNDDQYAIHLKGAKNAHFENVAIGMDIEARNGGGGGQTDTPFIFCEGATGVTFGAVHVSANWRTKAIKFDAATTNCGIDLLKRHGYNVGSGALEVENLGGATNYVTRIMSL